MSSNLALQPVRRAARNVGLRRTRVDAFRVYAMLVVIVGHSELLLGHANDERVHTARLIVNLVARFAVPLFLILAGEHIGPRLLRNQSLTAGFAYSRRLLEMFLATSAVYWLVDLAKLIRRRGLEAFPAFMDRQLSDPVRVLLTGARVHLWFLTVLMVVVLVANVVLARRRVRTFIAASVVTYALGLLIGPYAAAVGLDDGHFWVQWLLQSPLFFAAGVFFGLEREHPPRPVLATVLIAAGVALHGAEVYWLTTRYGLSPAGLSMLIGTVPYAIGVALLAFSPGSLAIDRQAARISRYVPLVYLGHMLVLELMLPPGGRFPDLAVRLLLPLFATVLSFWVASLLVRWRRASARRSRQWPVESA